MVFGNMFPHRLFPGAIHVQFLGGGGRVGIQVRRQFGFLRCWIISSPSTTTFSRHHFVTTRIPPVETTKFGKQVQMLGQTRYRRIQKDQQTRGNGRGIIRQMVFVRLTGLLFLGRHGSHLMGQFIIVVKAI